MIKHAKNVKGKDKVKNSRVINSYLILFFSTIVLGSNVYMTFYANNPVFLWLDQALKKKVFAKTVDSEIELDKLKPLDVVRLSELEEKDRECARKIVNMIPEKASVSGPDYLGAHLSIRETYAIFPALYKDADYVIVDVFSRKLLNILDLDLDLDKEIDKRMIFSRNKIESDYILKNSSVADNGDLVFFEEVILPSGYVLERDFEKGEEVNGNWKGDLIVKDGEGNEQARFHAPVYYDSNTNYQDRSKKFLSGTYNIKNENGKHIIQIIVPADWLKSPERVYPVTIDPPVTGPVAKWTGGTIPSCYQPAASASNLNVTIPAGVTMRNFYVSCNFSTNLSSSAVLGDGRMYFTTSCGRDPVNTTEYWELDSSDPNYYDPGWAWISDIDMRQTLACCFLPQCTTQTITLTEHLTRTYGSGGCNTNYIYTDLSFNPTFSAYVVGYTVGNPSGPANDLWSVSPGTLCADECALTMNVTAYDGVPPYTVTHPWASVPVTFGSYSGSVGVCGESQGSTVLQLTIPNCPSSICAVQSLSIPPPIISDVCGNTVAGLSAKNVAVNPVPEVTASPTPVTACSNTQFNVNLSSCVSGASLDWTATNGMSGSGNISTSILNNTCPSSSVTFKVTPKMGTCVGKQVSIPVTIIPKPNISLSVSPATACSGKPCTITPAGTAICAGATYTWDFNGGVAVPGTGSGAQQVTWTAAGTYTVTLTVDNGNGCSTVTTKAVTVAASPVADFSISPSPLCPGQTADIIFTGSAATGATYTWTFGTGTIISGIDKGPFKIKWNNPAIEKVTLTVTDLNGCKSDTITSSVTVSAPPTGNFTSAPAGCLTAVLNYTGTGAPGDTYNWNFNGGTATPSSGQGPISVSWPLPAGNHTVSLVVVTASGCTGSSFSAPVTVNNNPPTSSFTNSTACTGQRVTFTYTGNGAANDTYNWNFGTGSNPATATGQGPHQVTWGTSGSKTVSLTVGTGACVSAPTAKTITINPTPTATFTASPNSVCPGETATLTYIGNASNNATYSWNFGSGIATPGNGIGPHLVKWDSSGTYNVSLQVTENSCSSANLTASVVIKPAPSPKFTISSNSVCVGSAATITYTGGAPAAATYTWDFGGGIATPGNGQGPQSVSWMTAGNKAVTLSVAYGGCTAISSPKNIMVYAAPSSAFSISSSSICIGKTATITYTGGAGSGATYAWDFKGGSAVPGTGVGPHSVTWSSAGSYDITLEVTENGCTSSVTTNIINVNPVPTSSFNPAAMSVCANAPLSIQYTGNAKASAVYNWNLSGGNATPGGTTQGPQSVIWTTAGTKTVTLSVDEGGCSSSVTSVNITVNPTPTATFSNNSNTICLGTNSILTYTGNATGVATYTWNFGGGTGNPGTGRGPQTVTWTASGVYNVSLQVTENGCSSSIVNTINVYSIPNADFSSTFSSVCNNNPTFLNYTGSASGSASYNWNFDGGTATPGSGQGPQRVVWTTEGTKTVSLTVTENGCTSPMFTQDVTVNPLPVVSFNISPATICEGESVTMSFTGNAGSGATYNWIFDGGTPQSATGAGAQSVAYNAGGVFTSRLFVTDKGCVDSTSNQITVNSYPLSSFTISPSAICAGATTTLLFNGSAKPGAIYNWSFGNGQVISGSANGPGPISVKYSSIGTENISLTVDQGGCQSTAFSKSMDVNISPNADFDAVNFSGCDQLDVSFLNLSNGASLYLWSFGDNTADTIYNPSHHYGPGVYSVKLVAVNPFGCKDSLTKTDYIKVVPTPVALFTSSPTINVTVEKTSASVFFFNQTSNGKDFLWNFGDGDESNTKNPVHIYNDTGRYVVTLIAVNELGCSDTFSLGPYIIVPPAVVFIPSAFTPNSNGMNEIFKVYGTYITNVNMQVFNRWGELVYSGDGFNEGWDGSFHGKALNPGVYLYYIRITTEKGRELRYKGDVTLLK